ncbi:MAG TPA: hypothetical protein VEP30_08505 [Chthoniobacterales bacterium]|nr:hypothetical protein [Chthoniobacterales bacterium]
MKIPRLFNPTHAFTCLRLMVAGSCVLAAAALAFVATAHNNSSGPVSKNRVVMSPLAHDALSSAYETADDGSAQDPTQAADEEYAHRAYPADDIDLSALINAQAGYQQFLAHATPTPPPAVTPGPTDTPPPTATPTATPKKKKGGKKGKATPTPTPTPVAIIIDSKVPPPEPPQLPIWQQVGDTSSFTATDPNVLTFTGSTQRVSGRITALALDQASVCTSSFCRLWVGAAGGGIWRTTNGLAGTPTWTYISGGPGGFVTNAIGALTYDNARGVLYAGTGEPNASGDSEAGVGIYKSTDGGNTWTLLPANIGPITTNQPGTGSNGTYTGNAFLGRSISSIVVDPTNASILYVSSARGVRGVSSVTGAATSSPTTPRPPYGLFKSVDGGQTFSFIFDGDPSCGSGTCLGGGALSSGRGVTQTKLDPNNHNIVYASDFPNPNFGTGGGIWRSLNGGASWAQILPALNSADNVDRCAFDVTSLGAPVTRMYAGCGNDGADVAQFYRSDNAQGAAAFTNLTALEPAGTSFTAGYCTGQCWYDNFVFTPPGFPNIVYLGGSYSYGECGGPSDCRGVVMTQDGQDNPPVWNDMTWDAQDNGMPGLVGPPAVFGNCCNPNQFPIEGPAPNGIHPDQHTLVVSPSNPLLFFEGSDGGVVRSDGTLTSIVSQCVFPRLIDGSITNPAQLLQCKELLGFFGGGVPTLLSNINTGLDTLQFQSIRVAANNVNHIQGGTQDNGTWDNLNNSSAWNQVIFGDGGQGGFSTTNSNHRFNTFTGRANAASFANGNPYTWDLISGPILVSGESAFFYPPVISDPALGETIFQGSKHVWRTQTWGADGSQAFLDANCNVFFQIAPTGSCGDFAPLGGAANANDQGCLTCAFWGSRAGSNVAVISRTFVNTTTGWAATGTGRVFISDNINAAAGSVVWNRVDNNGANGDPGRFPTEIAIDPFDPHRAYISYSGYNFNTPSQKGHVFSVFWDGVAGHTATWTDISFNIWDIPITSVAFDHLTGDLYASSDFVVFRLAASNNPAQQWFVAGLNMPMVETAGLTIIPGSRVLYAATHGLGIWKLNLP